ncbi:hypothetical protein B296_00039973 [Ensete ventricosum]|uniref:Uncharacterized protein n=1 Tax=Ensete ventricosum TaxID=4639 RepID=A0A426YFP3_ENSVE|nr:hypothetical protein B296_00039973 [Ensete ventricosum]
MSLKKRVDRRGFIQIVRIQGLIRKTQYNRSEPFMQDRRFIAPHEMWDADSRRKAVRREPKRVASEVRAQLDSL